MYIYNGHTGGLFVSEVEIPEEELVCELCMDCDVLIGYAENKGEAKKVLESYCFYDLLLKTEDVEGFINENFKD